MPEKEDPKNKKKWYILDGSHVQLLIVIIVAILFYVGLNHFSVVTVRINQFMGVLSPFIVGFAIADRKSTRLNSSHTSKSRMPSSA